MHDFLSPRYGRVLSCVYKLNLVDLMMTMMLVTLHFITVMTMMMSVIAMALVMVMTIMM